jgi:hypothetical protein
MLLDYALLTAPSPLQAGAPATLTLAISNGGSQVVTVTSIVIALPIGTNAKDLTASASFQTGKTSGWNLAQSGGALTLTPAGSGAVGRTAVVVTIANVAVNDQPGTVEIVIDETAALGGGNPANNNTKIPLAKFPGQFSLSDLVATPTQVPFGGSASLMWTGTQIEQATYTLQYPGSGPVNVSSVGPYKAENLTVFPAVFTLTVSLTVPGQDAPATAQKQTTVVQAPELKIVSFGSSRSAVGGADTFDLVWEVQLATSLTLEMTLLAGSKIDVTGLSRCTVANDKNELIVTDRSGNRRGAFTLAAPFPLSLPFRLTASDGNLSVQASDAVDVLPPKIADAHIEADASPDLYWVVYSVLNAASMTINGADVSRFISAGRIPIYSDPDSIKKKVFTVVVTGYWGLTDQAQAKYSP